MLFRLILLFLIVLFILWIIKRLFSAPNTDDNSGQSEPSDQADDEGDQTENMLPCAYCGTHIPQSSAIVRLDKKIYCCPEHAKLDQ